MTVAAREHRPGRTTTTRTTAPWSPRNEIAARVAVVVVTAALLPSIFIGDIRLYWIAGSRLGLHHLPYRNFLWEFPPLTVQLEATSVSTTVWSPDASAVKVTLPFGEIVWLGPPSSVAV